jgi:S-adenosylmethionine:tRNA ribosyltransferase-isomerase
MKLKSFDYFLPKNLIAQRPIKPRDHSRLLVLERKTGKISHKHFYDIINYFKKGDILVLNNSKVFPARLIGKKLESGGKIEIFLLRKENKQKGKIWQCLIGGSGKKEGLEIEFKKGLKAKLIKNNQDGTWLAQFNKKGKEILTAINKIGRTPLPPYIKSSSPAADKVNYQTIYADDKKTGSVAAPTAGFHFTPALLRKLKKKGVKIIYLTLHVGLGTFAPVKADNIAEHKMHSEWLEIKREAIRKIVKARQAGGRIIAGGTTSARALETIFNQQKKLPEPRAYSGWTDIFIYPGYEFRAVDCLITNFHLPKSTLLMLVSALAGKKKINKAYKEAVKNKYRFYSYGDAMLII